MDMVPHANEHRRNPGIPLDLTWVSQVAVNQPAVILRAGQLGGRRCVKKQAQLGWLMRLVTLIDLTTLAGDDTPSKVERLCFKAKHPIRSDFLKALNMSDLNITTGAVCVYPSMLPAAVKALKGTGIPIASVAAGFPAGQTSMVERLAEIRSAVAAGATEIDIVITRQHVITGNWKALYDETKAMREACGDAHLKTILATGEHPSLRDVYKASLVCMMAGADFIKTSTGKESVNATLPVGLVMVRAIREFYERTGEKVGFKPAGGISNAKDACVWLSLMVEELGDDWTHPDLFRVGASSLLTDIERQLEHGLTGNYSASYMMPMS